MDRTYRPTLVVLFIVTLGGFAFAFISGFSIGRFVVVLPLLVTAYAVTYGRGLRLALAGFAAAVGLYLLLAWLTDWVYDWGIFVDLPICTIAYAIAFVRPPRRILTA
ncbi:MAG TPA: hypothetical protein VHK65_15920 [Candidatus Dormibacteraeota bacterium]|nr:hypothetical protein [Candidatus Dormibacteraeota bacterium]